MPNGKVLGRRSSARRLGVILLAGAACAMGLVDGGQRARGLGALCNGRPASKPALDASYQPGPALLEGTSGGDVIIGSLGGHDRIDGNGGDDFVCGGPGGYNSITVGPGNAVVIGGGGHERITGVGPGAFTFVGGPSGHNTLMNRGGRAVLYGGSGGNNTLIHAGPADGNFDIMDGGAGPDNVCIILGGDEISRCNDQAPAPQVPNGGGDSIGLDQAPRPPVASPPDGSAPIPQARVAAGYWLLGADGRVSAFGAAEVFGNASDHSDRLTHLEPSRTGAGYWIVTARGTVFPFGDAHSFAGADPVSLEPGEAVVSLSAPDRDGYWLFTDRGRVIPRGDAEYHGDLRDFTLNEPVVGAAATPDGHGYVMVAADGGVFSFGDATYAGSLGGVRLNRPVRALVPTRSGNGYWLVASDGGVFAFGDAPFLGSLANVALERAHYRNDALRQRLPSGGGRWRRLQLLRPPLRRESR